MKSNSGSLVPAHFKIGGDKMDYQTFAFLKHEFTQLEQDAPWVVYDVDDILWGLMFRVAKRANLDIKRCMAIFRIRDNQLLTRREQDYIIDAFADASVFENIEFFPGAEDILRPRELGAVVKINSNSFSERIAELKVQQLLAAIPGLTPDDIQMNIIDPSNAYRKPLDPRTTIFVDDSPYNVANSPAIINVMPTFMTWSHCPSAVVEMAGKYVIYRPSLVEINRFVYRAVEHLAKAA